ncbi:MAG: hypothetical protein ACXWLS_03765 [Myxococcaceae bacterium]
MRTRLLLLSLLAGTVTRADEPKDQVDTTWRARKELAQSRIAKGGLDACDLALEKAFKTAKLTKEKDVRSYDLTIDVDGRVLGAFYRYTGDKLDGFALVAMPSQWVAYQKADSKTIRFIVAPPQACAFSLCTSGPTADGPCETTRP